MDKIFFTQQQAAEKLGIAVKMVRALMKNGAIDCVCVGNDLRTTEPALHKFAEEVMTGKLKVDLLPKYVNS